MKRVVIGNGMGEPGKSECPVDIRPGERPVVSTGPDGHKSHRVSV
ncbi:MAG: hypothetical protein K0Q76_1886 [Panacagrimonas sp.]|nr:hypothetical protein [Panacagrimonas sp.]